MWEWSELEYNQTLSVVKLFLDKESDLIIFDVGANINDSNGRFQDDFTQFCFEHFGESISHIWAFEPVHFQRYEEVWGDNPKVTLKKLALASSSGNRTLLVPQNHELSSFFVLPQYADKPLQIASVKTVTLDQVCSENDITRIHILKLDIEGAEWEALLGASRMLQTNSIDVIHFELSGATKEAGTDYQTIEEFLESKGYAFLFKTRVNNPNEGEVVFIRKDFLTSPIM